MILLMSMVTFVVAFNIGSNLSQPQIDGLDVPSLDLSNGFVRDAQNNIVYDCEWRNWQKSCIVYANFTVVNSNYDEEYKIVDYGTAYHLEAFPFKVSIYRDIKQNTNLTYAKQQLGQNLRYRYNKYDKENKEEIEKYQTEIDYDVDELLSGIDLE